MASSNIIKVAWVEQGECFKGIALGREFVFGDTLVELVLAHDQNLNELKPDAIIYCYNVKDLSSFVNIPDELDLIPENIPKVLIGCLHSFEGNEGRQVLTEVGQQVAKVFGASFYEVLMVLFDK